MKYKAIKFRVNSVEHYKAIKRRLEEMGLTIRFFVNEMKYLYVDDMGLVLYGDGKEDFEACDYSEYTLDDLYSSPVIEDKIHKLKEMAQDMLEAINDLNYNND